MKRLIAVLGGGILATAFVVGSVSGEDGHRHAEGSGTNTPPSSQPSTDQTAIDLGNTVCPVSGDKVGDSKLTEVYHGKIYHLCCDDCPKDFKKDPEKIAKAVAADPAKYGVKKGP